MDNCIYNLLYIKFNEDFGRENYFSYNLQYPSFYNFKNTYFHVDPSILNNLNSTISLDVTSFKNGLLEEEIEYNKSAVQNALPKRNYKAISNYAVTFNKNHILSVIVALMGFGGEFGPNYNDLYNYNIDLLTGKTVYLKDIFNKNTDYIKAITDYVSYKISQDKDNYYSDVAVEIPEDQAFYITDDGIVIYFGVDEIAPEKFGIPKFKMEFNKFAPYINPRFYCDATNVIYRGISRSHRK
ncbi:MAG: DUF3298 domain-containing protein [Peptostreptococcaceae bacterium]